MAVQSGRRARFVDPSLVFGLGPEAAQSGRHTRSVGFVSLRVTFARFRLREFVFFGSVLRCGPWWGRSVPPVVNVS